MFRLDPKQTTSDDAAAQRPPRQPQAALTDAAARIAAEPADATMSAAVIVGVAQVAEAALLAVLGFAIFALYVNEPHALGFYTAVILGTVLVANIALNGARTHRIPIYRRALQQLGRVLAAWAAVMVLLSVLAFLFKASDFVSRVWLVSWFVAGAVGLVGFRLVLRALVRRWTLDGRGIAVRSEWEVADCIARGELTPLLTEWSLPNADIHAIYLERNRLSAKLRAFVDFLGEFLK